MLKRKLLSGLNREQEEALRIAVTTEENLFITGGAGTGKSYLIRRLMMAEQEMGKNVALCAPTGVASNNIGGVTLHRTFSMKIGPKIDTSPEPPSVLRAVDTVIIDEISMVRCDIFEYVMRCIIAAEIKWNKNIQVIVVGDFYQLPPILDENCGRGEKDVLIQHYGTEHFGKLYAFQSPLWQFRCAELTEVMRQRDPHFSRALNMTRKADPFALPWIDANRSPHPIEGAPFGVSSNKAARKLNEAELEKLNESTENKFIMHREGRVNEDDIRPFDHEVKVRDGALVMVLINDDQPKPRYVNGSIARVIRSTPKSVTVEVLQNGEVVTFYKTQHKVLEYSIDRNGRLDINVIGIFTQVPLKLCYAMTIHKMQGLTFEALNLTPATWEYGLLYTALSRVTSVERLYYREDLKSIPISCNSDVEEFYADPEHYQYPWPAQFIIDDEEPSLCEAC